MMKRYFYVSNDLRSVERLQNSLTDKGIALDQVHVLTNNESEADRRNLNTVHSLLRKDVIRSGFYGAGIGAILAALALATAYFFGWTNTAAGWIPFIFLAIVLFGFSTWEGGFLGFQRPHYQFKKLNKALQRGKHVLYVDVLDSEKAMVESLIRDTESVTKVSEASGEPHWFVSWRTGFRSFLKAMP